MQGPTTCNALESCLCRLARVDTTNRWEASIIWNSCAPTTVWGVQAGVGGTYYGVGRAGRRWWNLLRCGACRPALVAPTMVWGVQAGVGGIYYGVGLAGRRWWRLLRCGACRPALVAPTTVLGVQAGVGGTYYGVGRAGRRWWHLLRCGACRPALVAPTTVLGVQAGVGGTYYGVGRAGRRWWHLLRCGACRPALVESTTVWGVQAGVGGTYYGVGRAGRRWWKYLFWGLINVGLVNAYVLWTRCNRPLPSIKRVFSFKAFKLGLISDLTNDYASDWVTCLPPAIDVHVAVQMISEDTVDGHPVVQFARWNHACKYCARRTAAGRYVETSYGVCSAKS